ncbi:recQ-mediated genome instability protein 1 [Dionaea muscipula]
MPRRRLRLVCNSSDEEDEPQQPQQSQQRNEDLPQQLQEDRREMMVDDDEGEVEVVFPNIATVTLESSSSHNFSDPVEILPSDDFEEFMDVSDNLSPPSPPPPPSPLLVSDGFVEVPPVAAVSPSPEALDCPLKGYLRGLGLSLKREWLDSCVRGLESSVPAFGDFDVATKAKLCFGEFLFSDMNLIGAGVLPDNVDSLHLVDLPGPFVLQVDEIVNVGSSLRQRYQDAPAGLKRCLKLSMTDGVQRVIGMEYRPINDLEVLAPAGFKVVLRNVSIRRGLLMLVPEVLDVLGGSVEELEAARQRLVHEVNKPPRGKRSRTGVAPPLKARATIAAWQPHHVPHSVNTTDNSTLEPQNEVHVPTHTSTENISTSFNERAQGPLAVRDDDRLRSIQESSVLNSGRTADANLDSAAIQDIEDDLMVDQVEHPFILSGDRELPFIYLASLSAKWAALKEQEPCVQGKIKCFLTGVKGFQYKQRTTFELKVHVDDGSLISEILIHHDVVQKGIGYSPEEVTAALTSSNNIRIGDMKHTLKQFQIFLVNFEGTMLVEMNEASPIPVAMEMDQGCPASDAWLLIKRLRSLASTQPCANGQPWQDNQSDPIDLSP